MQAVVYVKNAGSLKSRTYWDIAYGAVTVITFNIVRMYDLNWNM